MRRATLVIGGGGLIGARLVPKLLAKGRKVTVLGRSGRARHELPKDACYVQGDFGAPDVLCPLLDEHDEVIHLAYATVPNTSYDNPLADLLENLPPTVHLFSEIATRGGRLLLISSGGTVYGEGDTLPINERHPTNPISPYGVTKLTLEKYASLYAVTRGLDVVCVRPSNAYGEGQRPFLGQGFVATAMASAIGGQPIHVFGRRGAVRDYLHVDDLAAGIVCALEHGVSGETYNLGSGIGHSNMDVLEVMAPLLAEIGCEVNAVHGAERPFDVRANVLDSTKLRHATGWYPTIGFIEGLRRTRDWLLKQDA